MRNTLLFTFLLWLCSCMEAAAASVYVPLVREQVRWCYYQPATSTTFVLEFSGTTTVAGRTYSRCCRHSEAGGTGEVVALLREDDNRRVYWLAPGDVEVLLYDFNDVEAPYGGAAELTAAYAMTVAGNDRVQYTFNDDNLIVEGMGLVTGSDTFLNPYGLGLDVGAPVQLCYIYDQIAVVYRGEAYGYADADVPQATRQVLAVHYYDMNGRAAATPHPGLNIAVTRYTDGTTSTRKSLY